ncbi:phosphopyruvate hydratase [Vibrio parahaemolyticus]|uniref:phosphopyruvate hydratase n=1 Tax=Vibrio fluvialis TaxID=676 RepID=UPI0015981A2D|nr:phosphopyruvate hydratase [Vibrio fluvialis]EGR3030514.1 phosphopyruvate hydratase [Vibrio parahaemolyticus]EJE4163892.1 phosphopyruvate hydratase [Vibrio parahaemolyticus]EJR0962177.1 phosphopyruvate hydratase [Vibrio parahaemolyticus]QKE35851.1 phosphopyruvate hydratase [Vibrio fluvialis]
MKIINVDAYQIFDSRGLPTVEAVVELDSGICGVGLVPSGASTGQFEALELRDGDAARFQGKSVYQAIANIKTELAPALAGKEVSQQAMLDQIMCEVDGTVNKSRLGANAILAVSLAIADANAKAQGLPLFKTLAPTCSANLLPLPEIQLVGGGAHAQWRTDIQDFLIIVNGAKSYNETLEVTSNIYRTAEGMLKQRGLLAGAADEGGFWPTFDSHEAIFEFVVEAIQQAGYQPGRDVSISLDIAASDLYSDCRYHLPLDGKSYTSEEFLALMLDWCERYPVLSIEDPFADTDFAAWKAFTREVGDRIQIIGDDLFTTNISRIEQGITEKLANSVLIKLNQIGTVSETLKAIEVTQNAGWLPVVSARSGETEDAFISHLAVATNAGQLKVGSFTRSERMVKWNEVIRIERALSGHSEFVGGSIFQQLKQLEPA